MATPLPQIPQKIANMTLDELTALIRQVVQEQLHPQSAQHPPTRSVAEILASIERHRWTPPPGTPSVVEMLREDRDR